MKIVNCYPGGPDQSWRLVLVQPDGTQELIEQTYDYFNYRGDRIRSKTWKQRQERLANEPAPTFEADVNLVKRFLADHPEVEIARPKRVWIDLETDSTLPFERKGEMRIIVACAIGEDGRTHTSVLSEWTDAGEAKLLQEFFAFLKDYQCVAAWNGGSSFGDEGFDFPVIRARCEHLWPGSSRRLSKWLWLDHLKAYKKLHLMFAETGE